MREAEAAFILLTPASIQKPWVIWEAGAVAGAAFATAAEKARVFPITYGIKPSDVPTPFARTQLVTGTDESDISKLIDDLSERFRAGFTFQETKKFGAHQEQAVKAYLKTIDAILLKLPHAVTEAGIQEWLARLDDLEREKRLSEAPVLESWLDVAFGREANDKLRPLDVRIHRRFGELYVDGGRPGDAARQFELARQLAPRDIFVLRGLGKAYLDVKDSTKVGSVLADIETLDPMAFERNAENAALKARWYEQNGNLLGARDALAVAYQNVPSSYYLGDRLGQILITLGERGKAKEIYSQILRTLSELREQNVWTHATALSAAIVCDDDAEVNRALDQLRELRPSRGEIESIERGVSKLLQLLESDTRIIDELRQMEKRVRKTT